MNLSPQLQRDIGEWANRQGLSTEQFVVQTIIEKIEALNQKTAEENAKQHSASSAVSLKQPTVYRKEGILVVDAEFPENLDINTLIDELREERISEQMALREFCLIRLS